MASPATRCLSVLLTAGLGAATVLRSVPTEPLTDPAINDVAHVRALWARSAGAGVELNRLEDQTPDPYAMRIYCFMVVLPNSPEVDLVQYHIERGMLSGCLDYLVVSNQSTYAALIDSNVIDPKAEQHYLQGIKGPMKVERKEGQVQNGAVFLQAWKAVFLANGFRRAEFVVKVDPDVVLFPHRMETVLEGLVWATRVVLFDGGDVCSRERGGLSVMSRELLSIMGPNLLNRTEPLNPREDLMLVNETQRIQGGIVWMSPNMLIGKVAMCKRSPWRAAYHKFTTLGMMKACIDGFHHDAQKVPPTPDLFWNKCRLTAPK
mmetsp:Transcript_416/g.1014  ORF Transcript_416/g.1014 Transcript_416/m.1014 type:complete len:319 (-) Transcript_416:85-1041(-)